MEIDDIKQLDPDIVKEIINKTIRKKLDCSSCLTTQELHIFDKLITNVLNFYIIEIAHGNIDGLLLQFTNCIINRCHETKKYILQYSHKNRVPFLLELPIKVYIPKLEKSLLSKKPALSIKNVDSHIKKMWETRIKVHIEIMEILRALIRNLNPHLTTSKILHKAAFQTLSLCSNHVDYNRQINE